MNDRVQEIFERFAAARPELRQCVDSLRGAFETISGCFRRGGKLLVCGNGGSAADSEHIVGELMKGFRFRRPLGAEDRDSLSRSFPEEGPRLARQLQGALPAISLVSQVSLSSAVANDMSPDLVFAQQVYGYGRPGDALMAISTSGNAANVLNAARVARAFGLQSVALTGSGGSLGGLCDVVISAPGGDTAEIQENHQRLYHVLCSLLEAEFFLD